MPFKAAEAVPADDLAYDLAPYGPSGTVPEPSRDQLDAYWEANRAIYENAGVDLSKVESVDPQSQEGRAALTEAFADIPRDKRKAITPERIAAMAELCQGHPSAEEIKALPFRHQEAFMGWLMGVFSNPSSSNGALSD